MDFGYQDKVVLVTGASGGIGRAMVEAFAAEGARLVMLGHRRHEAMVEWARERGLAERALCLQADVAEPEQVDDAFRRALERFGRVDVMIANAGIWPEEERHLGALDPARVRRTIGVNLLGAMWCARAFLAMLEQVGPRADGHGAALLFTGSTAGRFGERGHADYAAAKAGLLGLARSLKNEIVRLDPYGRVNVVEPGWTVTEMTRKNIDEPGVVEGIVRTIALRQIGRAADVARTALFLCSPTAARHISGQAVTVAGGMEGRVLWEAGEVDRRAVLARLAPD